MTFAELLNRPYGPKSTGLLGGMPRGLRLADVQAYLCDGGDINQRTPHGDTLLILAASNLQLDIVTHLLQAGADINAQGHGGSTALHHAVDMECNTDTHRRPEPLLNASWLLDLVPSKFRPQNSEFRIDHAELPLTALLLRSGADETLRDHDNHTPRDTAALYGASPLARYTALPRG